VYEEEILRKWRSSEHESEEETTKRFIATAYGYGSAEEQEAKLEPALAPVYRNENRQWSVSSFDNFRSAMLTCKGLPAKNIADAVIFYVKDRWTRRSVRGFSLSATDEEHELVRALLIKQLMADEQADAQETSVVHRDPFRQDAGSLNR
jgi:hypothetical protein